MQRANIIIAGCAAVVALSATAADAEPRKARNGNHVGFVVAESRYSGRVIAAPVRRNAAGRLEFRLRGGTWIECGQSCSETLRRTTIDFWDIQASGSNSDGPGYLRFRF